MSACSSEVLAQGESTVIAGPTDLWKRHCVPCQESSCSHDKVKFQAYKTSEKTEAVIPALTGAPKGRAHCNYLQLTTLGFYCSPPAPGYLKTHQIRFTPMTFTAARRLINDCERSPTFIWLCSLLEKRGARSTCSPRGASVKHFLQPGHGARSLGY